jgi:phage tail sheath protein FI
MPEYLHPGVYIEEIERGPRPIEGVATSTAAFLGETERGPTWPRMVTSYNDYRRWFGGVFAADKYMPYAVSGFFENGGKRVFISRIVGNPAQAATANFGDLKVDAVGPGSFGNRIFIEILPSTTTIPDPGQPNANPPVSIPVGFRIQVAYWNSVPAGFAGFNPIADTQTLPRPALVEDFNDLVFDEASADYFMKRVNGNSALITLELTANAAQPPNAPPANGLLSQGSETPGVPDASDYQGGAIDPNDRTGLEALLLDDFREVALVYEPGITDKDHLKPLIDHCEKQRFRFAVLDCAPNSGNPASIDPRTNIQESQYAAFYYPWIWVSDPQTGARKRVAPGGHMLGIYARTDVERGVFKAPANEVVRGALDLEYAVDEVTQDTLNPRGVNAIRLFPGRGILLWGARTLSSNTLWKYVSVRRLFIFLEHSIYDGTQWVVFEPNDERLWARVTDTIRLFLRGQWRAGAMMGATEQEAFFVTCDRTTMTQDDILNGRLVCEIGIAPVRPAEFVIFRIFQNTAEPQQ